MLIGGVAYKVGREKSFTGNEARAGYEGLVQW